MDSSSSSSTDIGEGFLADWDLDMMMWESAVADWQANQANQAESSRRTRRPRKKRDTQAAHERLMRDHFDEDHVYDDKDFKRRFRVSRELFERIAWSLQENFPYFQQRVDGSGRVGFSTYQKCAVAFHLLATGTTPDHIDEYLKMSDRTARDCLYNFCDALYELYHEEYLRRPNANDVRQLYEFHEARHGLPGMLGSLDCMHWHWSNCPTAYRGAYTRGDHGVPTVALEAVASQDLWIWHAYFGTPGSHNDITVIHQSTLLVDVFKGVAPDTSFQVNGANYKYGYYLVDGIYPEWAVLVKAFRDPGDDKRKLFTKKQESARKDIERAFGRLKKKFEILSRPSRVWNTSKLSKVMYACIILHNMTLEDLGRNYCTYVPEEPTLQAQVAIPGSQEYFDNIVSVQSRTKHHELTADLTEHVWANRSD